jgi:hypothetical protein
MIDPVSKSPATTNTTTSTSAAVSPDRAKRFSDALVAASLNLPTTNRDPEEGDTTVELPIRAPVITKVR